MTPTTPTTTTLARTIQVARVRSGLSMRALAKRSKVSVATIHRIENDAPFQPAPASLIRLADALQLDVDQLLDLAEARAQEQSA
jgi:transcriptional regulator with XRE-family HTH domain